MRSTLSRCWSFEHQQLVGRQAGLKRSRVRAQRLHSFMSNRGLIRPSPPSSTAKPDDINDNDRCHVLSNLALQKLNSEARSYIITGTLQHCLLRFKRIQAHYYSRPVFSVLVLVPDSIRLGRTWKELSRELVRQGQVNI